MKKKDIKKLALLSFTQENINPKKVKKLVSLMTRKELRQYVKFLNLIDSERKIKIFVPSLENIKSGELTKSISKIFPNKRVLLEEDPNLLLGVRILNKDILYDYNLKNTFIEMKEFIKNV